jgi:hypothetical protein
MRIYTSLRTLVLAAFFSAACGASAQYVLDDGTAENAFGFGTATSNAGSIWLNQFSILPGQNIISSLSIAWGAPSSTSNANVNGLPMQALIYSDPNGDGNPNDAILLSSVAGTIQSAGSNTFVTYQFGAPVTITTTGFFVGYFVPEFTIAGARQFFAAVNTTAGTFNAARSFLFGMSDGSDPDITTLSNNDFGGSNSSLGINGNWLVRANAIPEPGSFVLFGLGGLGLLTGCMRARRNRRVN